MLRHEYNYYAFISYSHRDEKWAKWIQRRVETYRYPTALRKEIQSLPKKFFPVFRDQTDLSGGILDEQLHRRLRGYPVVFIDFEYDSYGRRTKYSMFNADGEPVLDDNCYHSSVVEYDSDGCPSRSLYYGTAEELINDAKGVADIRFLFDERGFLVERSYYDKNGAPVCVKGNPAYHKVIFEWDENGRIMNYTNLDVDGTVINSASAKYDKQGRLTEVFDYEPDGKPAYRSIAKCPGCRVKYPETGVIQVTYLDGDGNLCLSEWGYAMIVRKNDEMGRLAEYHYYDTDLRPTRGRENYASAVREYNRLGRITAEFFYDENGAPCRTSSGYAIARYAYDNNGYQTSASYFDTEGRHCEYYDRENNKRYAKQESVFNSMGQETSTRYFALDAEHELVLDHEYRYDYNDQGLMSHRICTFYERDENKNLAAGKVETEDIEYDDAGREIRTVRLDSNGDVESVVIKEYNARGLLVREIFTDKDGSEKRSVFEYDDHGNRIIFKKEDGERRPSAVKGDFAFKECRFDHRGRIIHEAYFDQEHKPMNLKSYTAAEANYNIYGDISEIRFYVVEDGHDELVLKSLHRYSYDKFGYRELEKVFFNSENPDLDEMGDSNIVKEHNIFGDVLSYTELDRKGNMRWNEDGYYLLKATYNAVGKAIRFDCFDSEGNLMCEENGYPASLLFTLDPYGQIINETLLNESGKPFHKE